MGYPQLSSIIVKIDLYHVMAEFEKYITNVKKSQPVVTPIHVTL